MPYKTGKFTGISDLKQIITDYVTDVTIHGNDAWTLEADLPFPHGTYYKVKGIGKEDHFYIGVLYNNLTYSSYRNWLLNPLVVDKLIAPQIGVPKNVPYYLTDNVITVCKREYTHRRDGCIDATNAVSDYSLVLTDSKCSSALSIVKSYDDNRGYGQYLSFGVFKQHDFNLDWGEMGGSRNFDEKKIPFINFYALKDGSIAQKIPFVPPTYPGFGYPMLYTSNADGVYDYPPSKYWVIKDKFGLTVVIKNGRYWRTLYVGMSSEYGQGTNPFPALQIGSTGITCNGVDSPAVPYTQPLIGLSIDLSNNDTSMCNSLPVFPTRGSTRLYAPTQVSAMTPEGMWINYGNYVQQVGIHYHDNLYDYHGFPLELFYKYIPNGCSLYPTDNDTFEYETSRNYDDVQPHRDEYPFRGRYNYGQTFSPLILNKDIQDIRDGNKPDRITAVQCSIPRMYYANCEPVYYGEVDTDSGKMLIIPNVWQDRLSYYNYHLDPADRHIQSYFWRREDILAEYENMNYLYKGRNRMAIKLEGEL